MNKEEILQAIRNIKIDSSDFEHSIEDSPYTTDSVVYQIESENYNITLTLEETLVWSSYEDAEFYNLDVIAFEVEDQNESLDVANITDIEILECINY
jgi:predicted NACHT family NTPase